MASSIRNTACIIAAAVAAAPAAAQPRVGEQVRAHAPNFQPQNETSIVSSEANASRIVGSWNDYREGSARAGVSISDDAGQTWNDFLLRPPAPFRALTEGDPMTATDNRDGTIWVGAIAFDSNGGLFVSRLDPGAGAFGPVRMAALAADSPSGFIDKCWMAAGPDADAPGDASRTMLYIGYNDGVVRSSDRGDTWTPPTSLGLGLGFLPRVDPRDGALFVQYWATDDRILMQRSFDNGQTYSGPFLVARRMDVWGVDGTRFPGGFRVAPINAFALDPNDGTLYVVYFDTTRIVGANRDVDLYFTRSDDRGATWSTPTIIDPSGRADQGDSFFPWIEVDRSGRIHLVYYDTGLVSQTDSPNPFGSGFVDAYYAYSDDRGGSWTEIRLTDTTFDTGNDGFGGGFIGDYLGLSVSGPLAMPLYLSTEDGDADAFVRLINRCVADFSPDFGVLDFFDVSEFLQAFNAQDPAADLAPPQGTFDFFDISAYVQAFSAGCP